MAGGAPDPAPQRGPGTAALGRDGTGRGVLGRGQRSRGAARAGSRAGTWPGAGDTGQRPRLGPAAGTVTAAAHAALPSYPSYPAGCLPGTAALEFSVMQKLEVKGAPWLFQHPTQHPTRSARGTGCPGPAVPGAVTGTHNSTNIHLVHSARHSLIAALGNLLSHPYIQCHKRVQKSTRIPFENSVIQMSLQCGL